MPKIRIDNHEVEVEAGATILQAARKLGLDIPALCHREACTPNTSCLCCVVRVNGSQRLVPSCATKAAEGMVVESETPEIRAARRTALELLLADHAGDCFAPCTNVCPAHMNIPQMIRLIAAGQVRESLITVKQAIALPATLGRICPELCEKGCRRGNMDAPVAICKLKRHVADEDLASGSPYLPPCLPTTGKRVAIVGTGPTGLAAAYYLQQLGHQSVLLDEHPEPGGNLRYAVPKEKLPNGVVDAEIDVIRKLGAEFIVNTKLGQQVSLEELRQQYDAVLIATGEVDKAKAAAMGLELAGKGLKTDRESMMTPVHGVFAAGACIMPFKHAIRAVAEGRYAASAINRFLRGMLVVADGHGFTVRLGVLKEPELAAFTVGAVETGRSSPPDGRGFVVVEAAREAARCFHCDCARLHDCKLRDYSIAYDANPSAYKVDRRPYERTITHADVVHEPGKCIACGLCVQITERAKEPLGLTYIGRGFKVRVGVPFDEELSEALRQVGAECVAACPTGALTLRDQRHPAVLPKEQ